MMTPHEPGRRDLPDDRYRSAIAHDRQLADAYRVGVADGRREHRRLVVAGVLGALVVLGRRRVHPILALAWVVLVVVALAPLVVLAAAAETVHRQHRRWCSWPRTAALAATWAAVGGAVYLAAAWRTPWPLVTAPVALAAWAADHAWRVRGEGWGGTTPAPVVRPAGSRAGGRTVGMAPPFRVPAPIDPYRVTFTAKAQHVETRRYADGRTVTVDTRTGERVLDPLTSW